MHRLILIDHFRRRGTRTHSRALSPFKQAVLVLRWFLDATRVAQLACDNAIGKSTAYDYLHEGITVLAAHAPKLQSALLTAKIAGHDHISIAGARGWPFKALRNVSLCPWILPAAVPEQQLVTPTTSRSAASRCSRAR